MTLCSLTAAEAARRIASGELLSEELVKSCLARIAAREGEVQAWAHLDPEHALAQARAADDARRSGKGVGPLHGVPVAIKDIIDTADLPTENGSPIFKGRKPTHDAACVAALRNAGAVILGKTVSTELATLTPSHTRNPVNLEHSPGGSSAGSAAAVADFMVPAALGTQTAGSVIRPASYCGIVGFKPTLGLVSRQGVLPQSHTLDTLGVYGRSVEDVALITDCMSAYDPDDPVSYVRSQPRLLDAARASAPLPPLFAFVRTPAWDEADQVTRDAFEELVAALGAQVQEVEFASLDEVIAWQRLIQSAENAYYYGPLLARAPGLVSGELTERLVAGTKVPVTDYIAAVAAREDACRVVEQVLRDYTAILTPAAPGPAPRLSEGITGSPVFNGLWTYLGTPAVTLPLLEADGLPMGVQLVGQRRDDGRLLRTARWLVDHLAEA